jgi:uncharacterized protein HemX
MNNWTAFFLLVIGCVIIYLGNTELQKSKKLTENLPEKPNHTQIQEPADAKSVGVTLMVFGVMAVVRVVYYVATPKNNKKNNTNRAKTNTNLANAGVKRGRWWCMFNNIF